MGREFTTIVLAIGPGAMLGLLALGLVLIYRSTGTLNLAHGAMATLGAYLYLELSSERGLPAAVAFVAAALLVGLVGVVVQVLVMRPLREASGLTKLIATTGVLIVIQSALHLRFGSAPRGVPSMLPTSTVTIAGTTSVGMDRIILLLLACALTTGLWVAYRFTRFGLATEATAENPVAASAIGLRTDRLAMGNWFLAGVLAGMAGALLVPITGLNLTQLSALIVPALAAALVGSLTSFPLTLLGGILIAVLQAQATAHSSARGASELVPLVVIIVMMMLRGKGIPSRGFVGARLPAIGSGHVRPGVVAALVVGVLVSVHTWLPSDWTYPLLTSLMMGIVLLSVVVVTGYGGQVSLAQYALAGFGAFVAATVVADHGWPFLAAFALGIVTAVGLGAVLAIPAIRMRGVSLAVVTLAFSVMLYSALFSRTESVRVTPPALFGYEINPILHPERYLTFVLAVFTLAALAVANLRRGATGRRMIAVRGNERAAASVGINVAVTKLVAFATAAGIAAAGGILIAFQSPALTYTNFDVFGSINVLAWSVIGGVGYLAGPLLGMGFASGGLGSRLASAIFDSYSWVALIGGVVLVVTLILHPDGIASLPAQMREHRHARRHRQGGAETEGEAPARASVPARTIPVRAPRPVRDRAALEVTGISVSFGGVKALTDVTLAVVPGQVHGLIGPNGAGKTTVLDVISGFVRPSHGTLHLGARSLDALPPWRRSRAGLARSFQNGQLFTDLSVLDNLRVASDEVRPAGTVRDLVWPGRQELSASAWQAVEILDLGADLDAAIEELPYGRRQLVAIARALAMDPCVVMLDEPAAGLSERERAELGTLVRRVAAEREVGVLLIEHDVNLVLGVSDHVTVLHGGAVLASGPPDEIRVAPEVVAAYLGDEEPPVPIPADVAPPARTEESVS